MPTAALTPRVRTIVICDHVFGSSTEYGVFTLEGVRQHLEARSLPCSAALCLFMLLSSARKGKYSGKVVIIDEHTDQLIRYIKFSAAFGRDNELLPLYLELGVCVFPEAGQYRFEVHFSSTAGGEALKGEHPFVVQKEEE